MASQITSVSIVYSIACSDADQRKHQSFASLAFVRGIQGWPVTSPHKVPVTQKMFQFVDVIINHIFAASNPADDLRLYSLWCGVMKPLLANTVLGTPFHITANVRHYSHCFSDREMLTWWRIFISTMYTAYAFGDKDWWSPLLICLVGSELTKISHIHVPL